MLPLLLAALAAPPDVASTTGGPRPDEWSPRHPVALGVRGLVWGGEYVAPGFGGHLRIRPFRRFGVELFADHTHRRLDATWLHDNVIGFHAFVPLLGARRFYVAPTLGACVDFRVLTGEGPTVTDLRFAPHVGAQAELQLVDGVALELGATFYAYLGNDAALDGWTATTSPGLAFSPTGQATLALNVAL
jgi:hypothetical protein